MAGGTWKVQNKVRPGAYINFVAVPKPVGSVGERGVVAICLPMTWGPQNEVITLYGQDLLNGKSLTKIGCTAFDVEQSLPYRMALSGAFKALLYRADTGGVKALGTISAGSLTANAKHAGTTGNSITIVVTKNKPSSGKHTVDVLYKGVKKETFVVQTLNDFKEIESEWVVFNVEDSPSSSEVPATSGVNLANGTNGTVQTQTYSQFFKAIEGKQWQCLAINTSTDINSTVTEFIKLLREKRGKKVQAVLKDYNVADDEGIISVSQGFKTKQDTVTPELFTLYVAGLTAGSDVDQSKTAFEIKDAIEIINPIADEDVEDALKSGKFVITYRVDGAVCVEQDINTLHSFTVDKGYAFSKNRVIRCLDAIANSVMITFERNYKGKVDNDDVGRNVFKAELISLFDALQGIGAIKNFTSDDVIVLPGEDVDELVVDVTVQPVDSMEKLYMTVNVKA